MNRLSSRLCTLLALLGISAGDAGAAEPAANATEKPWLVSEANLPQGYPAAGPVDEVDSRIMPWRSTHLSAPPTTMFGTDF